VSLVPYRDTRRRRRTLDREQVVRAGLALLDERGLDAVTMRELASRLNVRAPSLYRHVEGKEELLILLADEICAGIEPPTPGTPWRQALATMARRVRKELVRHRDGARLLASTPPAGPRRLQLVEWMLSVLVSAGLPLRKAAHAGYHLNNFVTEFAADEGRTANAAASAKTSRAKLLAEARRQFRSLPAKEFPTLRRMADPLTEDDADDLFELGIQIWLDGLERARRKK
jgi:TetR/AcrR family tetracycline transcriptional repressor